MKFKPDILKALEEAIEEDIPQESIVTGMISVQCVKMRDYRRKILFILNAIRSIQRRVTFDLLVIRDCKIPRDMDLDYILT